MENKNNISDELLAAFLDGNTSKEETMQILEALKENKELQEVLDIALQTEEENAVQLPINATFVYETLPMLQKAALSGENICAVLCEIFILHRRQLPYDEEWLLNTARRKDVGVCSFRKRLSHKIRPPALPRRANKRCCKVKK